MKSDVHLQFIGYVSQNGIKLKNNFYYFLAFIHALTCYLYFDSFTIVKLTSKIWNVVSLCQWFTKIYGIVKGRIVLVFKTEFEPSFSDCILS